jgi:hypothetical protein
VTSPSFAVVRRRSPSFAVVARSPSPFLFVEIVRRRFAHGASFHRRRRMTLKKRRRTTEKIKNQRRRTTTVNDGVAVHRRCRSPSLIFYSSRSFAVFFSTSSDGDGETTFKKRR